jgi:hypothetical protein
MKKIKICSNWDTPQNMTKRLLDQFKTSDEDISNIEFVYDNSYDLIIFSNYITEDVIENKDAVIFFHEPTWTGNHQKNFLGFKNLKIFGHDKNKYNSESEVIETPSLMFYGGRGPQSEGWEFWNFKNLTSKEFKKNKKISSIVSKLGKNNHGYPNECLYIDRYNLIYRLSENCNFIDFFGWEGDKPNLKGFINEKKEGIVDYKFSICIENSNEKNYISEKFYDCILTDTIPIYFGCKNIKEIWSYNGYILLDSITDYQKIEDILNYIHTNCDYLYDVMLPELKKIKEEYFNKNNLLKKINDIAGNI